MSAGGALTGFRAAAKILHWLRAYDGGELKLPIDLDLVRQVLPSTPLGKGVRIIREPMAVISAGFEGALLRNPEDPTDWGVFYNAAARPERQRFTIAHELGHFVLHRDGTSSFQCDKESVHTGVDTLARIEREADDFAGNLLIPGDVLRAQIASRPIDFHRLSDLAHRFAVSLEAMCIRFIKYTEQRVVLVYWDYGYLKYQWRSRRAVRTGARLIATGDPQEPPVGTLAADEALEQEWDGIEVPADRWFPGEPPHLRVRELKHTYRDGNRVLSLLLLESAEPRAWQQAEWEGESVAEVDAFLPGGPSMRS